MKRSRIAVAAVLVAALASPLFAQSAAESATQRRLADRIQRLEDHAAIERLLVEYGRTLDARDFKAYSQLFAKDGVWQGGMGTVQGPAAIQAFMEKAIPGPNTAHNYHVLTSFAIDVNGDTATAWSRWTFVTPGAQGATIAQAGRYDDTFVRENGAWKFQKRTASNDTAPPK